MATGCCPSSINSPCPEVVPLTISNTSVTLSSAGFISITFANADPDVLTKQIVTLQAQTVDGVNVAVPLGVDLRFIESLSFPEIATPFPPTTPGVSEFHIHLDATGEHIFTVEHTGARKGWYLVAEVGGLVKISDSFEIG
jgi:hypothetical protein